MTRVATVVPAESDLLCEGCGYTLNGLPTSSNCPECGKPIRQSLGEHRSLSQFEVHRSVRSFLKTTAQVIFAPRRFYSTTATRAVTSGARLFSEIHLLIAAILFGLTMSGHGLWVINQLGYYAQSSMILTFLAIVGTPAIYAMMHALTTLAAWLSAIEGRYWGMRLPYQVVMRGLLFHRAHYLPVGLLSVGVVWGYRVLLTSAVLPGASASWYLYTLCGVVIASAGYLFNMYWIAMRNMMYANR